MWIKAALVAAIVCGTAVGPLSADPATRPADHGATVQVVGLPPAARPTDNGTTVQVAGLTPGTVLRGIKFTANTPDGQPGVRWEVLQWAMDTKTGQPYSPETFAHDLDRLFNRETGLMWVAGFNATVGPAITYNPARGLLTIPIVESHIGRITVTGNSKVTAADILGQMHARPGDIYDNDVIQRDMTRLFDTGAFSQVGPYQVEPTDAGQVNVMVPVVEKK